MGEILGEFFPDSSLISLNFTAVDVENNHSVARLLRSAGNHKVSRFEGPVIPDYDPEHLKPAMTLSHEMDHYRLLFSTPFGLLIWRIYQCLKVNIMYINTRLTATECYKNVQMPYLEWLDENFSELLNELGKEGDYIYYVFQETEIIRDFLYVLLGQSDLKIGEFVKLANTAFLLLGQRSDVKINCTWSTKLDKNELMMPQKMLTSIELIEASARHRELASLEHFNFNDEQFFEDWKQYAIHGVYERGFNYLLKNLGNPTNAKVALDIAFSTPIDITGHRNGDLLMVEDILPSYRIEKIVKVMKGIFLEAKDEKIIHEEIAYTIAAQSKIPSPGDTYQALLNGALWGNAMWGGNPNRKFVQGKETEVSEKEKELLDPEVFGTALYYNHINEVFRSNFEKRLTKSYFFIGVWKDQFIQPLMIFYDDFIHFEFISDNSEPLGYEDLMLVIQCYKAFCMHTMIGCLLGGGKIDHLRRIEALMRKELMEGQEVESLKTYFTNFGSIDHVLVQFGEPLASVLREAIKLE